MKMKTLATLPLLLAPFAVAASSVDLSVQGTITPSACGISLSQGGKIEYGKLSVQDLDPTRYTDLPTATLRVAVACENTTLFGITPRDNRPERPEPINSALFGLGVINENQLVGAYYVFIANRLADEAPIYALVSTDEGQSWSGLYDGDPWRANYLTGFGYKSLEGPTPIKDLSFDMLVSPIISPTNKLTLDQDVPLDGSATLELRYL